MNHDSLWRGGPFTSSVRCPAQSHTTVTNQTVRPTMEAIQKNLLPIFWAEYSKPFSNRAPVVRNLASCEDNGVTLIKAIRRESLVRKYGRLWLLRDDGECYSFH